MKYIRPEKLGEVQLFSLYFFLNSSFVSVTGSGGLAYNTRRGVLGAIPLNEKIAYHLYNIRYSGVSGYRVQLIKKEKWHKEHSTYRCNRYRHFLTTNFFIILHFKFS